MAEDLMLVGSVPYETAEDVFRAIGPTLGPHMAFMPDGEIGERIEERRSAPQIHRTLHKFETDTEAKGHRDKSHRPQFRPAHCNQTREDRVGDKVINLVRVKGCGGNPNRFHG